MGLASKKCVACEGGISPMGKKEAEKLVKKVKNWKINDSGHLVKELKFKDFKEAIVFINKLAILAEKEGHHPDFSVHYNKVNIETWTHAINGLSENDFILAAKIDKL